MRAFGPVIIAALALAGCEAKPELKVDNAWVRLGAVPGAPAAAYFTVHGGPSADRLIAVTAENAIRSEMHDTMKNGTMASMRPITGGVAVPAAAKIAFEPGGRHVMLFSVNPALKPPRTMPIMFTFASGTRFTVNAVLKRAGDE